MTLTASIPVSKTITNSHTTTPTAGSSSNAFESLRLAAPLLRALADEGYHTPTPIQVAAIPPVLEGRDLLGCAQTGTGKTAAFALPILHRLLTTDAPATIKHAKASEHHGNGKHDGHAGARVRQPRALVLSPTRELAVQIDESFAAYGRHAKLASTVVYGGVSQVNQVRALQRGVDILVATPGRLMDLMQQRLVNLNSVEVMVLDEADRMLDMGFIDPVRRIAAALPNRRQTLLFSATMPREIMKLADSLLRDPVKVAVTPVASTVSRIQQSIYMVGRAQKPALLQHLLEKDFIGRALVFTRTKHGADRLCRKLNAVGIASDAIHGDKAQNARQRALKSFRDGRSRVLVATDVAARGIDVDGITHVFNFDLPHEPEAYVHRIGRTARAGASGIAIGFCDGEERPFLRDIEKLIGQKIDAITKLPALPEGPGRAGRGVVGAAGVEAADEPREHSHHDQQAHHARQARQARPQTHRAQPAKDVRHSHAGERSRTTHASPAPRAARAAHEAPASAREPRGMSDWSDRSSWSRKPTSGRGHRPGAAAHGAGASRTSGQQGHHGKATTGGKSRSKGR